MIAVEDQATAGTRIYPDFQGHVLPMLASAAILTRIGRVDSNVLAPSFFRFGGKLVEELRPRGVMNAFCQTMVVGHVVDVQVFYRNDTETVYDLPAFLMGEVVTSEFDALMHAGYGPAMLTSFRSVFGKFAVLALYLSQGFLSLAKESRILDFLSIGKGGKGFQSYVYPDLLRCVFQAFRLTFHGKRGVPFACTTLVNSERLDLAMYRAMVDHFDTAHFGEAHAVIMREAEPRLWESEAVIATLAFEAGIARVFSMLTYSTEKGFEGQVYPHRDVLQDLGMYLFQGRAFLFQDYEGVDLTIAGKRLPILLPSITPFLKQVVIEPSTFFQCLIEQGFLFLAWIDAILKYFMHILILTQIGTDVKERRPPNGGTAYITVAEARGLTPRFDKKI